MSPDEDPLGLPASIEMAWGLRERPTRGPKPGLSLERVVDAALAAADSDGVAGVSMGRVASDLGASTMALYRYVTSKHELLALVIDAAVGAPPAEAHLDADWRARLSAWAWAYHEVLRRRPWILQVPISGPAITPHQTAWLERGLATLESTRLPEAQKLSVMLLLSGFVRNEATLAADLGAHAGGDIMPGWAALLRQVAAADSFPALHRALQSEAFAQDDDPDDEFTFGLERILDGVATLVAGA
jgi:AcrR family transcriptional regulator